MANFCTAMDKHTVNEKGCLAYTVLGQTLTEEGQLNNDLGLVALDGVIGSRLKGKKKVQGTTDQKLDELYNFVYNNIYSVKLSSEQKQIYIGYLLTEIFKLRDIVGGNGERDLFYKLLIKLNETQPELVINSLSFLTGGYNENNELDNLVPSGSFLDLNKLYVMLNQIKVSQINKEWCPEASEKKMNNKLLLKKAILEYYVKCLKLDEMNEFPTWAGKWAPRENKEVDRLSGMAKDLARLLYPNERELSNSLKKYRKLIANLNNKLKVLETLMSENKWDEIEVKRITSKAFMKYMKGLKNENKDGSIKHPDSETRQNLRERVLEELNKAKTNPESSKLNVKTLMPHEIVSKYFSYLNESDKFTLDAMWSKYENEFKLKLGKGKLKSGICLADVSGSMHGIPMEVCIALTILLSGLLEGPFKDKCIIFSENPYWTTIKGNTLDEKIQNLKTSKWGMTTNFGAVLDLILKVAKSNKIEEKDMPDVLYVFSDMQWDAACGKTNSYYKSHTEDKFLTGYESIKKAYEEAGYKMPHVVFWNLRETDTSNNNSSQEGTTMLSGYSANLFKAFTEGQFDISNTPWDTLKEFLDNKRYDKLRELMDLYYVEYL
jgi:hypothetical protein